MDNCEIVREIYLRTGLPANEICGLTGVKPETLRSWLEGKRHPRDYTVQYIKEKAGDYLKDSQGSCRYCRKWKEGGALTLTDDDGNTARFSKFALCPYCGRRLVSGRDRTVYVRKNIRHPYFKEFLRGKGMESGGYVNLREYGEWLREKLGAADISDI